MSLDDAAGWALSRSQSVSVVPMIQCRPHGMTNSTDVAVRRISPDVRLDPVARDDQVDALGRPHLELAALPDHRLGVVGPDPGGVDHLPRPHLDVAAVLEVAHGGAHHPLALAQEPDHAGPVGHVRPERGGGAHQRHRVPGVVDAGVVVPDGADQGVLAQGGHLAQRLTPRELLVHRDAARPRRQAGHRVVQRETRCDVGPLPEAPLERVHERDRVDEVRREPLQQQTPLAQRLPHQPEVEHLQVAQPAVDQLGRARRRAAGPVAGLDQRDAEPAGRGVEGRPGADDPAADDEDVDLLGRHLPQRRDPLGGAEAAGQRPSGRFLRHARHHAGWYGDTTTSTRWSSLRSE